MFFLGFFNPLINAPFMAIAQAVIDPDKQGRVFTLINSLCSGMSPLGLIIAGPLADRFGVPFWFVFGGIACAIMTLSCLSIPIIANLEQGRPESQGKAQEKQLPIKTMDRVIE